MELVYKVIAQTGESVDPREGLELLETMKKELAKAEKAGNTIYMAIDLTVIPSEISANVTTKL